MNNRKPSAWESFTDFISGKGFYLVVLLCLAAIGVSGWFLVRSTRQTGEEPPAVAAAGTTQMPVVSAVPSPSAAPKASAAPSQAPAASRPSQAPAATAAPTPAPSAAPSAAPAPKPTPEPKATPEPSPSLNPASRVFTRPVNGAVIAPFAVETLLYDETMLDWRAHEGIDLAAPEGTRVLAAAAGTVTALYDDELMGTTMVVDHGGGLTSVYANLQPQTAASVGTEVFTGDVLGAVGNTALAESGRQPHLHLAMYRDGEAVDPEEYLPE